MRISQVLAKYWLFRGRDFSPHTRRDYTLTFDRLVEFMRDCEFSWVTSTDVSRFLNWLQDEYGVTDKTLSNVWAALSSLWTWAELELRTPHVIRGRVRQPRFHSVSPDSFTQEEIAAMVAASPFTAEWTGRAGGVAKSPNPFAERDRAIILTLADTGARAQELCDFIIEDYDRVRKRLYIRHGKGGKGRYVVVGVRTRDAINHYLETREKAQSNEPLFATKTNRHISRENLRRKLKRIGDNAGVYHVFPHRFRHTFAIQFLRNGGNLFVLKELLGHSQLDMVLRYARIADQDIAKAVEYSPIDGWEI